MRGSDSTSAGASFSCVAASDMQSGLYVYRPVRSYGLLRARVVSSGDGSPLAGVPVHLTTQGDSLTTSGDGIVQFGPSPGAHTVEGRLFGYFTASQSRTVSLGSRDTVVLSMVRRPLATLSGVVRDAVSRASLDSADIELDYSPIATKSDGAGSYALAKARASGACTSTATAELVHQRSVLLR